MSVVIPGRKGAWGVLGAHTRERRSFTEDDVHFLQAVAALLGAAVRRFEDELSLRRRAAELEAVAELGRRLRHVAGPEEVQQVLVDYAATVTASPHAALLLVSGDGCRVAAATGAYKAFQGQQVASGPVLEAAGPRAEAPLVVAETRVGSLVVARRPEAPGYEEAELRVLQAVAELGAAALSRAAALAELEQAYVDAVVALARAMDSGDTYTADHSERMARWAEAVARRMGCSEEEVREVRWAALLHDIGKLATPDAVLRKPGPLTPEEWEVVKRHPVVGEEILKPVRRLAGVARLVRHHQERWDGTGYPDGLRGGADPLGCPDPGRGGRVHRHHGPPALPACPHPRGSGDGAPAVRGDPVRPRGGVRVPAGAGSRPGSAPFRRRRRTAARVSPGCSRRCFGKPLPWSTPCVAARARTPSRPRPRGREDQAVCVPHGQHAGPVLPDLHQRHRPRHQTASPSPAFLVVPFLLLVRFVLVALAPAPAEPEPVGDLGHRHEGPAVHFQRFPEHRPHAHPFRQLLQVVQQPVQHGTPPLWL